MSNITSVEGVSDHLIARARARAEAPSVPPTWGYPVQLAEGEHFTGRWRAETTDPDNERPRYLFWNAVGEQCFMRNYKALDREVKNAAPKLGDMVVVYRGADYPTEHDNPGQTYGVVVEPCSEPLPESAADDIPF
jgi:hypothetical protein